MNSLEPEDIIALVLVISCAFLLYKGIDGTVKSILISIPAYYFGKRSRRKR